MACTSCNDNTVNLAYTDCTSTPSTLGCTSIIDAQCVVYNGDTLECLGVETGESRLEAILQLIDTKLCESSSIADYTSYNMYCLLTEEEESPATQQEFVESISRTLCNLITNYENFTETTHGDQIQNLQDQIFALNNPGLTCTIAGVTSDFTVPQILTAYCTAITNLSSSIDLDGVDWNQCFAVTTPTTVAAGFNAVIDMICSLSSDLSAIESDSFKVKTSASDPTENYLVNKFTSACMTFTEYTAMGGEKKINVGITIPTYTFDTGQFDTTTILSGQCGNTYLVSIKPELLTPSDTVNCTVIDSWYNDVIPGTIPFYLLGSRDNLCQKIDGCGILGMISEGLTTGNYVLKIDTAGDGCSSKYSWEAAPTLDCSTIVGLFSDAIEGQEPTALIGTSGDGCGKMEACGIRNWLFDGYADGTYNIVIDTSAPDAPCGQVTLVAASTGGVTPVLPCWDDTWSDFSGTIDTSCADSGGNPFTIGGYGSALFSGAPTEDNPSMKFDVYGNLLLKGTFTFSGTVPGSDGECRGAYIDIPMATLSDSCFTDITKGQTIQANVVINMECPDLVRSFVTPYIVLDVPGNTLYCRIYYSTQDTGTLAGTVSLDGITFNLG